MKALKAMTPNAAVKPGTPSGLFRVTLESWNTKDGSVRKVVTRDTEGKFHGATNLRGSVLERNA